MGILDMFKRREDDFDDLLKEPEGGNWNFDDKDPLAQEPPKGPLADGNPGIPQQDQLGGGQGQSDVMGLPPQTGSIGDDMGLSSDPSNYGSDSFDSSNPFSQETTSASALNLDTNYPSSSQGFSGQQQSQQSSQQYYPNESRENNYNREQNESHSHSNYGGSSSQPRGSNQEFDLILTKLDLIKSTLQNLDNRLYHIEKKVLEENAGNRNRW